MARPGAAEWLPGRVRGAASREFRQLLGLRGRCCVARCGEYALYFYDAAGQRARKVVVTDKTTERIYIGGAWEVYRDYGSGTSVQEERETLHVMDGEQRVAMVETLTISSGTPVSSPAPVQRYQIGNHLGSVAIELDSAGSIISYEEYHPHGTTAWRAPELATVSLKRHRYTGMERDPESGLQCHGRRYYVPWLGRWLSADPIGVGDGVNRYGYCHGDPVGGRDGSGLGPENESLAEPIPLRPKVEPGQTGVTNSVLAGGGQSAQLSEPQKAGLRAGRIAAKGLIGGTWSEAAFLAFTDRRTGEILFLPATATGDVEAAEREVALDIAPLLTLGENPEAFVAILQDVASRSESAASGVRVGNLTFSRTGAIAALELLRSSGATAADLTLAGAVHVHPFKAYEHQPDYFAPSVADIALLPRLVSINAGPLVLGTMGESSDNIDLMYSDPALLSKAGKGPSLSDLAYAETQQFAHRDAAQIPILRAYDIRAYAGTVSAGNLAAR